MGLSPLNSVSTAASAPDSLIDFHTGPRLVFECATEVMEFNRGGGFELKGGGGPPPAVQAILKRFSGREELCGNQPVCRVH